MPGCVRRRLRAAHRQRALAQRRRLGLLLRRRPAHPGRRRLRVRGTPARRPARAGRLHILEAQRLIRFMPKVVICVVPGLGGRRRAQPPRGLRPDARQCRARALQADRRRRRQLRRRLRLGLPGPPGRAEVRPRDLLPRPRPTRAEEMHADGRGQRGRPPRRARAGRARVGRGDQRQEPHRHPDAQVRLQPHRRRAGRPAAVRRRGHPPRLRLTARRPRAATPFLEKRPPDWSPFPWHY